MAAMTPGSSSRQWPDKNVAFTGRTTCQYSSWISNNNSQRAEQTGVRRQSRFPITGRIPCSCTSHSTNLESALNDCKWQAAGRRAQHAGYNGVHIVVDTVHHLANVPVVQCPHHRLHNRLSAGAQVRQVPQALQLYA